MTAVAAIGKELPFLGKGAARRDFDVVRAKARFLQEQPVGLPQVDGPDAIFFAGAVPISRPKRRKAMAVDSLTS